MGNLKKDIVPVLLLFFFLFCYSASAAIIGVSPSIARFPKMLKGGYAETPVLVTTSNEVPIKAHLTPEGDIKDWIIFDPDETNFTFSKDDPYDFTMIIQPPGDTQSRNYSGLLKITTDELETVESGAGSSIIAQISLLIYVEVIGDEIILCRAGAISASSAEIGSPFGIRATVFNDGNVRLRPEIEINVWDQYQSTIVFSKTFLGGQILPTKNRIIENEI